MLSRLGGDGGANIRLRLVFQPLIGLALLANVWLGIPSLYLLGIGWGMFVAFLTFVTLLLD